MHVNKWSQCCAHFKYFHYGLIGCKVFQITILVQEDQFQFFKKERNNEMKLVPKTDFHFANKASFSVTELLLYFSACLNAYLITDGCVCTIRNAYKNETCCVLNIQKWFISLLIYTPNLFLQSSDNLLCYLC